MSPHSQEGIGRVTVSTVTIAVSVRTPRERYYRDSLSELGPEIDHAKVSEILGSVICYFQEGPATLDMSVICALVREAYVHRIR